MMMYKDPRITTYVSSNDHVHDHSILFLSGLDEGVRGSEEAEAKGVGDGCPEALRHHHSTGEVSGDRDIEA